MSAILFENTHFRARPRVEPWSYADYALTVGKIAFFPITALYYLISYCCSLIAYPCGVGDERAKDTIRFNRYLLREKGGEDIHFLTEDGIKLEGMHFQNANPIANAKTVLICTGSHQSYDHYALPMVDALLKMGHNVMIFNYRGFGKSEGTMSQKGFYKDAEAAYQFLKQIKGVSDDQLVAMGYSLGSAPATDLAAHHKIDLVLDRYFSSMHQVAYDEAATKMGLGPIGGLIAKAIFYLGDADFDVKRKIQSVKGRIFLAQGIADTTVHLYHEGLLKQALSDRTDVIVTQVAAQHHHTDEFDLWFHPDSSLDPKARQQLTQFLSL